MMLWRRWWSPFVILSATLLSGSVVSATQPGSPYPVLTHRPVQSVSNKLAAPVASQVISSKATPSKQAAAARVVASKASPAAVTAAQLNSKGPVIKPPTKIAPPRQVVDQRRLWTLLRRGELASYDRLLRWYKRALGWHPPNRMVNARIVRQIDLLLARKDTSGLIKLVHDRPRWFSCARTNQVWQTAELLGRAGGRDAALALYQRLIPSCSPASVRLATLSRSQSVLDGQAVDQLAAVELAKGRRDAKADAGFTLWRHDRAMSRLATLDPASDEAAKIANEEAPITIQRQEPGNAERIGWVYFNAGKLDLAKKWFDQAVEWQPVRAEARYGLALTAYQQQRYEDAAQLVSQYPLSGSTRSHKLLKEIALKRASDAYQHEEYDDAVLQLGRATRHGAATSQVAGMQGWSQFKLGRYQDAVDSFNDAYQDQPSLDNAKAYTLAQSKAGQWDTLKDESVSDDSVLAAAASGQWAQFYADRGMYLAAKNVVKNKEQGLPTPLAQSLEHIDTTSLVAGSMYSFKSGDSGTSRLTSQHDWVGAEWVEGGWYTDVRYDAINVNSGGSLSSFTQLGHASLPQGAGVAGSSASLQTLSFEHGIESEQSWSVGLAATQGGAESSSLEGSLHFKQLLDSGSFAVDLHRESVKDSLLSWRGLKDTDNQGQVWGGVTRNGVKAIWIAPLSDGWSMQTSARADILLGDNVHTNSDVGVQWGAGYDLKPAGYQYLSFGPQVLLESYHRDSSQFSWGDGGYYSPYFHVMAGPSVSWLSDDGRQFQWRGSLSTGLSHDSQSSGRYDGVAFQAQLSAAWAVHPHWQINGLAAALSTPGNSRQWQAGLNVRYLFEARHTVVSRDLPQMADSVHTASYSPSVYQ